jgi:hypothetical protein
MMKILATVLCVAMGAMATGALAAETAPTNQTTKSAQAILRVLKVSNNGTDEDYCRLSKSGLVVRIKNVGNANSAATRVRVYFAANKQYYARSARALAPGSTTNVTFAKPKGWCDPNCGFSIKVGAAASINGSCTR